MGKYRAWVNGKMKEVLYINFEEEWFSFQVDEDDDDYISFRFATLMPSTGKKDKNKKEIFDRDIVSISSFNNHAWLVRYSKEHSNWMLIDLTDRNVVVEFNKNVENDCVVLGNTFENPNYLNGGFVYGTKNN